MSFDSGCAPLQPSINGTACGYGAGGEDTSCLGGAEVRRRIRDRKVASLTPGRGAIKSFIPTHPSIPPWYVN